MFRARFAVVPLAIMGGGQIAYVAWHRDQKRKSITPDSNKDFAVGSIDDKLMDSLQTGDMVLFRRKWYYQYFPMAALIYTYRYLANTEYDHVGVIVVDHVGKPWIIENTPAIGPQCRRFEDRIRFSDAELIAVQPITPRGAKFTTVKDPFEILTAVRNYDNEMFEMIKFIAKASLAQVYMWKMRDVVCPNAFMLRKMWKGMGIKYQKVDRKFEDIRKEMVTLKAIENKEVELVSRNPEIDQKWTFAKENILVRTR